MWCNHHDECTSRWLQPAVVLEKLALCGIAFTSSLVASRVAGRLLSVAMFFKNNLPRCVAAKPYDVRACPPPSVAAHVPDKPLQGAYTVRYSRRLCGDCTLIDAVRTPAA